MKAIGAKLALPVTDPACLVEFEADEPIAGPQDLVVRIEAVAVNPVDTKVRKSLEAQEMPRILGWDAAGVVEAVGTGVTNFRVGDRVYYSGEGGRPGCNAQYQAVDQCLVGRMPQSLSFGESAALPLTALTAWELLFDRMGIDPGGSHEDEVLLIINGAGGVGSIAIQLAKSAGLKVIATASRKETIEWCLQQGADEVINHREPLRPQLEALGVTEVPWIANLVDTDGYWEQTSDLVAPQGVLGFIVEPKKPVHIGDPLKMKSATIVWEFMFTRSRFRTADLARQGAILQEIAQRVDSGMIKSTATREGGVINVENLRAAHAEMEAGTAIGKTILVGW